MEEDKIKYGDLISPDDSIKNLISQLTELNKTFGSFAEVVAKSAKEMASSLKSASSATAEGKTQIDEATMLANRYERAMRELRMSTTELGKEIAYVKNATAENNRQSAEAKKASKALAGSYEKLRLEMKEYEALYKGLSKDERNSPFGEDVLRDILTFKSRLAELDGQLKIHVKELTEVEKAEKQLNFLRSQEGQRLLDLKQQIKEVVSAHGKKKEVLDEVAKATQRYQHALSATNAQVQKLNYKTQEANRVAKLTVRVNTTKAGSYNQLAAQYELNKIKLNAMSDEERHATEVGQKLEAETLKIYKTMIKLQEATGNHKLSVGNYKLAWSGLGNAMNQVLREIPNVSMGMNMFFLSISNNIPILIDEINKLRAQNKALAAEGKATTSVMKTIVKTIFSWQTALLLCITALAMHGKEIWEWTKKMAHGGRVIKSTQELLEDLAEEVGKSSSSFGQNVANLKKLSREWKDLSDDKARVQWIKDNKTEFDKLDVSINNVNDAENVFVKNTDAMIEALKLRAKQTAAMKLAADYYEKSLQKAMEAEQTEFEFTKETVRDPKTGVETTTVKKTKKAPSFWDKFVAGLATSSRNLHSPNIYATPDASQLAGYYQEASVRTAKNEAESLEVIGDEYIEMMNDFGKKLGELYRKYGFDPSHKKGRKDKEPRDLTDLIWRNDLTIQKKYEASLTDLQRHEFEKRRLEVINQTDQTIREMDEKFRKNEELIRLSDPTNPNAKYKPLTPEQKAQIEKQQKKIEAIKANVIAKQRISLQAIDNEYNLTKNQQLRAVMPFSLDNVAASLEKEKQLVLKQIDEIREAYATKGQTVEGEVDITTGLTPEEEAAFEQEKLDIIARYDELILKMQKNSIDTRLELARKGSQEELDLLEEQIDKALQLELVQNRLKPVEQRESEDAIRARSTKRGNLARGKAAMERFDDAQARAEAEFNIVKRNDYQITLFRLNAEKERWEEMVKLAKQGMLDWSDAQIAEAEATIKKRERESKEAGSILKLIGDKGVSGALLTKLGFDDDSIAKVQQATDTIIENIQSIMQAEVEAAEAMVEAANKRVEAAQAAYDAEIEGRNNGYANNVATAKKELQLEKKNQQQKQKLLEEAQRRQEAVNTAVQTSSLVTASAELWSSLAGVPIIGPALALAAIATMWGSFAVSKIKAAQVTKASQEYGEGGLEFLEGGSHASGNDIDLHTTNSKGRNMRAEGGEAMAIINRRNTRKYHKVLPQIVDSLNKGTFEEKFSRAFETGDNLSQNVVYQQQMVDLSRLEEDVRQIKRNGEVQYYSLPNGTIIEKRKNVTRIIH